MKRYNYEILTRQALQIIADRGEAEISGIKLAALLNIGHITAYRILYMLQDRGFLDADYQADLKKIKAYLVQNPPSSER